MAVYQLQDVAVFQLGALADQLLLAGLQLRDLCGVFVILRVNLLDFRVHSQSFLLYGSLAKV